MHYTLKSDVRSAVRSISMACTIVRGNGHRENLGIIAYWHAHWFRRLLFRWFTLLWNDQRGMATLKVVGGQAIDTNRIKGAGTEPLNIGWGTGTGSTTRSDTALFTEVLVDMTAGVTDHTVGTSSRVTTTNTNDTYRVTGTRTATASGTITNAGLFDAASGGTLYIKGDFAGQPLVNTDSMVFTINVQYA